MGETIKPIKSEVISKDSTLDVDNIILDTSDMDMPKSLIPQEHLNSSEQYSETKVPESELINCLRNEKITIRYILRATNLIKDRKHSCYGGLADKAHITITVPMLNSGGLVNVLTKDEKEFLEHILGLEHNALSIYKKVDNFWTNYFIRLTKDDSFLNLSDPHDYIKYKVLLANKNIICPSINELKESPKRTYRFYLVSEKEEVQANLLNMTTSTEAHVRLGSILEDKDALKYVVEIMTGKAVSPNTKLDYLSSTAFKLMQDDPKLFLSITKDTLMKTKVFIYKCIEHGLIRRRDGFYYLSSNNAPLAKATEDPTINNAARFLNNPGNQDIKFTLEAKIKSKELK